MERVHVALVGDGLHGSRQRLPEHLPAEHRAPAEILALAAEEIDLDALEGQELHQIVEDLAHAPRSWFAFAFAFAPALSRASASSTSVTIIVARRA